MKKGIITVFLLVLLLSLVVAQEGMPARDGENDSNQKTPRQIDIQPIMAQDRIRAQTAEELSQMIRERRQAMIQEQENLEEKEQKVYMNQNTVREAVHAMLASENLVGGIGRDVSEIARQFNNSVRNTIAAETQIQKRSWFRRMMLGGDKEAAKQLGEEAAQNQERVQELKRLMENCECEDQVKTMLQEQIQNMEQEQTRLHQLGEAERKKNGLFGWIFNRG